MKQFKYFIGFLIVGIMLSSCFDIEENIIINADNSGTYSFKIDASKMAEMMAAMGAGKKSNKPSQKLDTVIYLKPYIDTASSLTANEKTLYKESFFKVHFDEESGDMLMITTCPFTNISQLADIKNNLVNVVNKFKLMEKISGKDDKDLENGLSMLGMDKTSSSGNSAMGDIFLLQGPVFSAQAGNISNVIADITAFKEGIAKDSTLQSMQQMATLMGSGVNYKTVVTVPSEIKKYEGPAATLSSDKKTVTYSYTLNDILKQPETISYKTEY